MREGWQLNEDVTLTAGAMRCRRVTSKRTGLQVVLCEAPTPVVATQISIPTAAYGDGGDCHALEHMCFLGSRKYPVPPLLDELSAACLATTTNAWTDQHMTNYQMWGASEKGMLTMLPVYLDHLLYPILSERSFQTEVFSITPEGENSGVVFSEMESHANEASYIARALAVRQLYPEDHPAYKLSGGFWRDVMDVTLDDVKHTHAKFYTPRNMTISITGQCDLEAVLMVLEQVEDGLSAEHKALPSTSQDFWGEAGEPGIPPSCTSVIHVAADSPEGAESTVVFCWRLPEWQLTGQRLAISVVHEFLTHGPSSPIMSELVENPECEGMVADVEVFEEGHRWPSIGWEFSQCDPDTTREIERRARNIVQSVVTGSEWLELGRIKEILEKRIWSVLDNMETDPIATLEDQLAHRVAGVEPLANLDHARIYEELKAKDRVFWRNLIQTQILDMPCQVLIVTPSFAQKQIQNVTAAKLVKHRRETPGAIPALAPPLWTESERKVKLAEELKRFGRPLVIESAAKSLIAGTPRLSGAEVPWSSELAAKFFVVDMDVPGKFSSAFVDMNVLLPVDEELRMTTLMDFMKQSDPETGKPRIKKFEVDIQEFIRDLGKIDFETRWREKQALVAKEAGQERRQSRPLDAPKRPRAAESSSDSDSDDNTSSDDEPSVDLDDFCSRALLFVLEHFTVGQAAVLFEDLMFNCDLKLPVAKASELLWTFDPSEVQNGRVVVDYKDVHKALERTALEYSVHMGLGYSVSDNSYCNVGWKVTREKFVESLLLLRTVLEYTDFTVERLIQTIKKEAASINSQYREGDTQVLKAMSRLHCYPFGSVSAQGGPVIESLLRRICLKYPEIFEVILREIWSTLRKRLISPDACIVANADATVLFDHNNNVFSRDFPEFLASSKATARTPDASPAGLVHPIWLELRRGRPAEFGPIKANFASLPKVEDAASLTLQLMMNEFHDSVVLLANVPVVESMLETDAMLTARGDVCPDSTSPFASLRRMATLDVVCNYLSGTDGPFFAAVRNIGAAYGGGIRLRAVERSLNCVIYEASKPSEALEAVRDALNELLANVNKALNGDDVLYPTHLQFESARSTTIYDSINSVKTPDDLANANLDNALLGLPLDFSVQYIDWVGATKFDPFLRVAKSVIEAILNSPTSIMAFSPSGLLESLQRGIVSLWPQLASHSQLQPVDIQQAKTDSAMAESDNKLVPSFTMATAEAFLINAAPANPKTTGPFAKLALEAVLKAKLSQLTDLMPEDDEDEDSCEFESSEDDDDEWK